MAAITGSLLAAPLASEGRGKETACDRGHESAAF